ncbi:macro domain-containing protein [Catellatospora sp. NPDC049609]|uniref:macro domain-containing protein n=1 Tax=Catellatospora sp. NPDC049609 TaxID=3155505 RepID=UPI00342E377E
MTPTPRDHDPAASLLRAFCLRLGRLRTEADLPVVRLLQYPEITVKRSRLYEIFRGDVKEPPEWELVDAIINRCRDHAIKHGRLLGMSTDPSYWKPQHSMLVELRGHTRHAARAPEAPTGRALTAQVVHRGSVTAPDGTIRHLGIITGDIRHVRCAEVWVNPENTEMVMARAQEFSISAIIRYEGAERDDAGRITVDTIADELEKKTSTIRPIAPGSAVITGAGALARRNDVRLIVHTAAVQGEPGTGFRAIDGIAQCVDNTLLELGRLDDLPDEPLRVLFPLLGTGVGGGDVPRTATALIHAAANYLRSVRSTRISAVLFLAYTDVELRACLDALTAAGVMPTTGPAPA